MGPSPNGPVLSPLGIITSFLIMFLLLTYYEHKFIMQIYSKPYAMSSFIKNNLIKNRREE